ncbi:MAG TPA: 23S rRNA (pseudouridine(1915)-N(3))-methyltransferase RlmH, partial [Gemmatimonadales bacterium]|nr:23S rRNA (pseudouridine(1915)-N(3))-methyltransferase RlmH [Gemmatimonadales bacterium]
YARRLQRYVTFQEHEIRESSRTPSVATQLAQEAERLGSRVSGATLVVLAREGTAWTSRGLAQQVESWLLASRPVALVIGGSQGLDPSLLARASARWSLGPLTLPHELARVVVTEQLYRAFTILKGEPYHKGM